MCSIKRGVSELEIQMCITAPSLHILPNKLHPATQRTMGYRSSRFSRNSAHSRPRPFRTTIIMRGANFTTCSMSKLINHSEMSLCIIDYYCNPRCACAPRVNYMYMYMQILVTMGIQWGHGLSECYIGAGGVTHLLQIWTYCKYT